MSDNKFKGIRYHKQINLGKFLRLNISKTGIGLSVGIRGLRYTRGSSGTFLTVGLPGSGLRYQKKLSNKKGFLFSSLKKLRPGQKDQAVSALSQNVLPEEDLPELPKPGLFAPRWEKDMFKGVEAYHEDDLEAAIEHLQSAVTDEEADLGAKILLAFLLIEHDTTADRGEAIGLLEEVVTTDEEFPTPILETYMQEVEIDIAITPQVEVTLPISDGLAPTLLLVELYQEEREMQHAIGLLEEVDEVVAAGNNNHHNQILTLSLAELYFVTQNYQAVINTIQPPETVEDDIILGILFFYGRALQEQNLHTGAIKIFNKSLKRKRGLNSDLLHACRLWRAMSFLKTNQKARSRKELERILAEGANDQIRQATLQALQRFWPQEFQTASSGLT